MDVRVPLLSQNLATVPSVKDLGNRLDSNLTFNEHVNIIIDFIPYLYVSVSDKQC